MSGFVRPVSMPGQTQAPSCRAMLSSRAKRGTSVLACGDRLWRRWQKPRSLASLGMTDVKEAQRRAALEFDDDAPQYNPFSPSGLVFQRRCTHSHCSGYFRT